MIGEVNFEMGQYHELSVEARDRGNPQRSNVVTLQVEILNEDDENPRFPISFYTADVDEGTGHMTTFVLSLSCSMIVTIITSSCT